MNRKDVGYEAETKEIQLIDLEAVDYPVEIVSGSNQRIRVTFSEVSDMDEISCDTRNHTMYVRHSVKHCVRVFLGLMYIGRKIIIEIPKDYHDEIRIKTRNGSIKTDRILTLSKISMITSNGSIHVNGIKSLNISLSSKNGSIRMEQVISDKIAVETNNGSITGMIMGSLGEYNIDSHTVNGSNNLPERMQALCRDKSLSAHTNNGRIRIEFIAA